MDQSPAFPPFRMKAATAAFYCGMSVTQFYRAVDEGEMPGGRKAIGGRYWLREELERAMLPGNIAQPHDFSQPI